MPDFNCQEGRLLDWNLFGDHAERTEAQAAGLEPALGWFLSQRSAKWIAQRANQVAALLLPPLPPARTGPYPKKHTVVGDSTQPHSVRRPDSGSGSQLVVDWPETHLD